MRILYTHHLRDREHPAARMARFVATELSRLGHEVRLLGLNLGEESSEGDSASPGSDSGEGSGGVAGVSRARGSVWFAREIGRNREATRRLTEVASDYRPDAILGRQDAYFWAAPKVASRLGIPLTTYADAPVAHEVRTHGLNGRWHPPGLVEGIERWGLARSRTVVTVSEPAREILERYKLGEGVRIRVVPNGVEPGWFPEWSAGDRAALRARSGIPEGAVVFGFHGGFRAFHGIGRLGDLIEGSRGFGEGLGDRVRWVLLGEGPESAGLRRRLEGDSRVIWLGRKPAEEVGKWLGLVDVSVAPHDLRKGPFYFCPLKVLEACAAGHAVVAGRQGDLPRLLDDGSDEGPAGVLLDRDDPEEWLGALERLGREASLRKRLGIRARAHVLSRLTWNHTARGVASALEEAIGRL